MSHLVLSPFTCSNPSHRELIFTLGEGLLKSSAALIADFVGSLDSSITSSRYSWSFSSTESTTVMASSVLPPPAAPLLSPQLWTCLITSIPRIPRSAARSAAFHPSFLSLLPEAVHTHFSPALLETKTELDCYVIPEDDQRPVLFEGERHGGGTSEGRRREGGHWRMSTVAWPVWSWAQN